MLIDDDEIFNFLNKRTLELSGVAGQIDIFTSARNALQWLQTHSPEQGEWPGIILLDIRMPDMDGFEFLEAYQKLPETATKGVKIYMLTSSFDDRDRKRALAFPFVYGYYSKPMNTEMIAEIEEAALGG
jgi:CheY-like chemotaxis protein